MHVSAHLGGTSQEDALVTIRKLMLSTGLAIATTLAAGSMTRVAAQDFSAPAVAPAAPSSLTYYVNGSAASFIWNAPANGKSFTHYVVEGGIEPGNPFVSIPTNGAPDPSLQTQKLARFDINGLGAGTYYVRVRAANNAEVGPPSNEVAITIKPGNQCHQAGTPMNLTSIVRLGNWLWLQWAQGSGGLQSSYNVVVRDQPAGNPILVIPTAAPFVNFRGIPPGTFYVTVQANSRGGCPVSAESNQVVVQSGVDTPPTVPNPAFGRLPMPYVEDLVQLFTANNPGLLQASCPNPNSKYTPNPYLDGLVGFLRLLDTRFGFNAKPTRGPADNGGAPVVLAGDEIAYQFGSDVPEGSANAYLIDVVSGHCGRPSLTYRDFTFQEFGIWTAAGRF